MRPPVQMKSSERIGHYYCSALLCFGCSNIRPLCTFSLSMTDSVALRRFGYSYLTPARSVVRPE